MIIKTFEFNLLQDSLEDFSQAEPELVSGTFKDLKGNEVTPSELTDSETKVLVVKDATDIVIDGEILCYNEEVTMHEKIASSSGYSAAVIIFR